MKRLYLIKIGVIIESHEHNLDAEWGDTNVFEDEITTIADAHEDVFRLLGIEHIRQLKDDEVNGEVLRQLEEEKG